MAFFTFLLGMYIQPSQILIFDPHCQMLTVQCKILIIIHNIITLFSKT